MHLRHILLLAFLPALVRAEWLNVTTNVGGEKWGYAGVCLLAAVPDSPAIIAGVSEAGLWRTDDARAQKRGHC